MADDDEKNWYSEDRAYSSSRDSDDSPLLSHRTYDKRRYEEYTLAKPEERERRSTVSVLMKFFLFCTAMISFCVLMYIPVYNRANDQIAKALVAGWTTHTNRDTKLYVLPDNVTTIYEPSTICPREDLNTTNKLFLLIIVCSSTENFDRRIAIRNTWGNQSKYRNLSSIFNRVTERYEHYNFSYDLYVSNESRARREASSFAHLLPELAKALQSNLGKVKTDTPEMLPEFDMNKELGEKNTIETDYDYDYHSNVMKIPPNGYEDSPDLNNILKMLQGDKNFPKIGENLNLSSNSEVDFKLAFLLGLPGRNDTEIQVKIEEEIEKYGDVIQEDFIDSYNNLTLKSIMMLKWITNKCNESVRYILKTDDDMYINVPNLISNLRNRSRNFDQSTTKRKEYLLIGDLICNARPVLDANNKWYSPRYMYGGRVYPRYLSGTGYLFSSPAAHALYNAALRTPYFHLEDIYITGMCASRASPRLHARDDPLFQYTSVSTRAAPCSAHAHATAHRVSPAHMHTVCDKLMDEREVDRCERMRLTQVRRDRLRPKPTSKRTNRLH